MTHTFSIQIQMETSPQIASFRIHFTYRKNVHTYIKYLHILETHLRTYGLHFITKIIFYFVKNPVYPSGIHTITLEKKIINGTSWFVVVFFHYYNARNQLVDMKIEQCIFDYTALLQYISPIKGLHDHLKIIQPSFACPT